MAESIRDQIRTPAEDPLDSKLSRDLLRQFRSGTLVRLRRASYIAQSTWLSMDEIPRHLARMHAIDAAANSRPVFAAESAALLWGLPVQSIPERVQINVPPGSGQRSRGPAVRRQFPQLDDGEWFVDGLKVTSAVQTAVELALRQRYAWSIASLDNYLHGPTSSAAWKPSAQGLREAACRLPSRAKTRRVLALTELADAGSMSVGESISRANMHLAGLPKPTLQACFHDDDGLIGYTDFCWREFGVVGEFDGKVKYRKPEYLQGRDPAEVVIEEKIREDRLRALGLKVVRWTWATANSPNQLRSRLVAAGLPC